MIHSKKLFNFVVLSDDEGNTTVITKIGSDYPEYEGKFHQACLCGPGGCDTPHEVYDFINGLHAEEMDSIKQDSELGKLLKRSQKTSSPHYFDNVEIDQMMEDEAYFTKVKLQASVRIMKWRIKNLEEKLIRLDQGESDERKILEEKLVALTPEYERKRACAREELAQIKEQLGQTQAQLS